MNPLLQYRIEVIRVAMQMSYVAQWLAQNADNISETGALRIGAFLMRISILARDALYIIDNPSAADRIRIIF